MGPHWWKRSSVPRGESKLRCFRGQSNDTQRIRLDVIAHPLPTLSSSDRGTKKWQYFGVSEEDPKDVLITELRKENETLRMQLAVAHARITELEDAAPAPPRRLRSGAATAPIRVQPAKAPTQTRRTTGAPASQSEAVVPRAGFRVQDRAACRKAPSVRASERWWRCAPAASAARDVGRRAWQTP